MTALAELCKSHCVNEHTHLTAYLIFDANCNKNGMFSTNLIQTAVYRWSWVRIPSVNSEIFPEFSLALHTNLSIFENIKVQKLQILLNVCCVHAV